MVKYDVAVENLCKNYSSKTAVNNLSFQVKHKEIFGVLGHNGAGKTTTIECMLGVRKKDRGNIRLLDKDPYTQRKEIFQKVGVQFQETNYPDKMNVWEACEVYCSLYEETADVQELLRRFHLEHFKHRRINELSGGERQRLSVLLALICKPQLVFLDELTTGLDTHARRELWDYLKSLKQEGLTVILSSHYMDEVEMLCDRILILKAGSCAFMGTVAEAKKQSDTANMEDAYLYFTKEEEPS